MRIKMSDYDEDVYTYLYTATAHKSSKVSLTTQDENAMRVLNKIVDPSLDSTHTVLNIIIREDSENDCYTGECNWVVHCKNAVNDISDDDAFNVTVGCAGTGNTVQKVLQEMLTYVASAMAILYSIDREEEKYEDRIVVAYPDEFLYARENTSIKLGICVGVVPFSTWYTENTVPERRSPGKQDDLLADIILEYPNERFIVTK